MHDGIEIGGGRLQAHALFETRQGPDNRWVLHMKHRAVGSGPQTQRKPYAGVVSVEALRHDADQRARPAVEEKSRAEDSGVSSELRLPQAIVHHEHERRTRLSVVGRDFFFNDTPTTEK